MVVTTLHLHEAKDAEGSFALKMDDDDSWRATRGFGQDFQKVWSLEVQSLVAPNPLEVDWEQMLERAIEAYEMSDPLLANFEWPDLQAH